MHYYLYFRNCAKATVAAKEGNNKIAVVTGVKAGSSVITATAGNVTATYYGNC